MSKTIANLVLEIIHSELETILNTYPHHPYQQAFSAPDLRQQLISHVLSQMAGVYVVVDEAEENQLHCSSHPLYPNQQRQKIRDLIQAGIEQILLENPDWVACHIPQEADPALAPSSWFG